MPDEGTHLGTQGAHQLWLWSLFEIKFFYENTIISDLCHCTQLIFYGKFSFKDDQTYHTPLLLCVVYPTLVKWEHTSTGILTLLELA
jgi:hypothetical protein